MKCDVAIQTEVALQNIGYASDLGPHMKVAWGSKKWDLCCSDCHKKIRYGSHLVFHRIKKGIQVLKGTRECKWRLLNCFCARTHLALVHLWAERVRVQLTSSFQLFIVFPYIAVN